MFKKLIIILAIGLSGCASREVPIAHDLSKDSITESNSMVILSTWAPDKSISFASMLTVYKVDGNRRLLELPIDNYVLKPHFQDGWGFLHVTSLPPGEYRFELYNLNPYYTYDKFEPPFTFRIEKNEIVYLGEASLMDWYLKISDRSERDISMFLNKNPEFSKENIKIRLPRVQPKVVNY